MSRPVVVGLGKVELITALRPAGWTGPWGVEIFSYKHRSLPVGDALRRAADSARRQLARVGRGPWSVIRRSLRPRIERHPIPCRYPRRHRRRSGTHQTRLGIYGGVHG
jgi:hypothetical protein